MQTTPELSCDVLVIGSGAAGLSVALRLAEHHSVIVLSKGPVSDPRIAPPAQQMHIFLFCVLSTKHDGRWRLKREDKN